jgi:hypothetical protein
MRTSDDLLCSPKEPRADTHRTSNQACLKARTVGESSGFCSIESRQSGGISSGGFSSACRSCDCSTIPWPKSVSLAAPIGNPHEIVVEVPRGLLNQIQSDLAGKDFTVKAIALDLARGVYRAPSSFGESAGKHDLRQSDALCGIGEYVRLRDGDSKGYELGPMPSDVYIV